MLLKYYIIDTLQEGHLTQLTQGFYSKEYYYVIILIIHNYCRVSVKSIVCFIYCFSVFFFS